jgi:hypothetical protein
MKPKPFQHRQPFFIMSKALKIASFIATGAALGALAGKMVSNQVSRYRKITSDTAPSVKRFMESAAEEYKDFSFI